MKTTSPAPAFDLVQSPLGLGTDPLWPWPRLVAHRGAGRLAPENTLEALALGSRMGWMGAEVDAMLSLDGVAMLSHDDSLRRAGGRSGRVAAMAARELDLVDVGSWMGPRWAGAPMPRLCAALEACADQGSFLNVEIKPSRGKARATGEACARSVLEFLALRPEASGRLLFSSFSKAALAAARAGAPSVPRALLLRRGAGILTRSWLRACARLECVAVHAHHFDATASFLGAARAAGLGTLVYTVDNPQLGSLLLGRGASCLCCDDLDAMGSAFPSLLASEAARRAPPLPALAPPSGPSAPKGGL